MGGAADRAVHPLREIEVLLLPVAHGEVQGDVIAAHDAGGGEGRVEVEAGAGVAAHRGRVLGGGDHGPLAPLSVGEGAFEEFPAEARAAVGGVHGEEGEDQNPFAHERDRHARDAPFVFGQPRPFGVAPKEVPVAGLAALHLLRRPAAQHLPLLHRLEERGAGGVVDRRGVFWPHGTDRVSGAHRIMLPEPRAGGGSARVSSAPTVAV